MLLALDPSTRTGWAAGVPGIDVPEFGVADFSKLTKTDDPRRNGAIISAFRAWLNEQCFRLRPRLVCYESPYIPVPRAPRFRKAGSAPDARATAAPPPPMDPTVLRRLLGETGTIEAVCWELGIDCFEARTVEFVKFFTGRGSWGSRDEKKRQTILACASHGWDVQGSDDAADALALWCFAEDQIAPEASIQRRRLAANAQRQADGGGPLFTPRTANAPGPLLPGAKGNLQSDEGSSSNAQQQYTQFATGGQRRDFIGRRIA